MVATLTAIALRNSDPRCYFLDSAGHVLELSWVGNRWYRRDVSADCGAPPAAPGSVLAGYERVNYEPRVCYLDAEGELHELRWADGWLHADLSRLPRPSAPSARKSSPLTAFKLSSGDPRYYYVGGSLPYVLEIAWRNSSWKWQWLGVQPGTPEAAPGSALAGYERVNYEPRICYFDSVGDLFELCGKGDKWSLMTQPLSQLAGATTPAKPGSPLVAFKLGGGEPRYYYLDTAGHVNEIAWTGNSWYHKDVTRSCFAPPAAPGSELAGYERVDHESRVCYLDTDGHLHELRWDRFAWRHADLSQIAGATAPAKPDSGLAAFKLRGGEPRYYYLDTAGHVHEIAWSSASSTWDSHDLWVWSGQP